MNWVFTELLEGHQADWSPVHLSDLLWEGHKSAKYIIQDDPSWAAR